MQAKATPLKQFLRSEGRRQNWLAEQASIDPATLSRIVTGRLIPTERERAAIASALGCDVADLWPAEPDEREAA
jgi:lambda repressor-like predicted transcriptional regulator